MGRLLTAEGAKQGCEAALLGAQELFGVGFACPLCCVLCLLYEPVGAQSCQARFWSSWIPLGSKGCSKGCFITALCVCALHKCLSTSAGSLPLGYRVEETVSKLFTFSHGLEPKPFVFCLEASLFPQETWSCILPLQNGNGSHVHLLCYHSFGWEDSKGAPGLACSEKLPAPNLTVAVVTSACESPQDWAVLTP